MVSVVIIVALVVVLSSQWGESVGECGLRYAAGSLRAVFNNIQVNKSTLPHIISLARAMTTCQVSK